MWSAVLGTHGPVGVEPQEVYPAGEIQYIGGALVAALMFLIQNGPYAPSWNVVQLECHFLSLRHSAAHRRSLLGRVRMRARKLRLRATVTGPVKCVVPSLSICPSRYVRESAAYGRFASENG
ncbi:MAG: hypothetical protein BRD30_01195 [Bacteroidetes bacterium QH_2_63_10]|nr:MAG: hypothetical protein BRD30_01195 [Bacteroidetes bacterium QH_2_63_10]